MLFHKRVWIVVFAMALATATLRAQTGGAIVGIVQDESAAAIPGATVTVTNVDTGINRFTVSDEAGRYRVTGLIPGNYQVQAELAGFQTAVRKGLTLNVGSEIAIPMVLRAGQVEERIEVTAAAPMIQTANAALGAVVEGDTVRDLPLNGRSFDQLISLQSSAPTYRPQTGNGTTGFATAFTINGAWQTMNTYMMDGVEVVGGALMGNNPGGVLGKNMGVDAIQEFQVLTGSYSAEYGKHAGAIVNIATRSGTNALHGSGYEFTRNAAFDSQTFFSSGPKPPFKRNQFGATIGGPIRKDRTFFFANYEGLRDRSTPSLVGVYPDDNARNGFLPCAAVIPAPSPCPASGLFNVGVAPAVRPFIDALAPRTNGKNFGDGTAEYRVEKPSIGNQDYVLARIDHQLSDEHFFMGRYNTSRSNTVTPNANPKENDRSSTEYSVVLEEKWIISPTILHTFRAGYVSAFSVEDQIPLGAAADPALRFFREAPYAGAIQFTTAQTAAGGASGAGLPLSALGVGPAGCCLPPPDGRHYGGNQFDFADQLFLQRGAHAFTVGGTVQKIQHNVNFTIAQIGAFAFPTLQRFLEGRPSTITGMNPSAPCTVTAKGGCTSSNKEYRQTFFATYLQDDYKVGRNLTLNLGVRYELLTVPFEVNGRVANWRPETVNGILRVSSAPTLGNPMFNGNHNLVAPRIGGAWDVFGNGRTAVRGGWGIFFDQIETVHQEHLGNSPPYSTVSIISNPPFPLGFTGGAASTALPAAQGIDPEIQTPTRYQHNVSIQQQIGRNMAVNVGYVGARMVHLSQALDVNSAIPQILPDGSPGCSLSPCYFFAPGSPARNPAVAATTIVFSTGKSDYNAAQVDWVLRTSYGLRSKVSFTWAKNTDTVSNLDTAQAASSVYSPQNSALPDADQGLSAFHTGRNLVANFTYDLPFTRFALVRGWTVGMIGTFSDGVPKTIFTGFNRAGDRARNTASRPNLAPGRSNNPVQGGWEQYFDPTAFVLPPPGFYGNVGRNTLIGPGYANVDVTLEKSMAITASRRVLIRAEAFNVLNRVNFGLPNTNVFTAAGTYSPSAGRITSAGPARQLQFGIKYVF